MVISSLRLEYTLVFLTPPPPNRVIFLFQVKLWITINEPEMVTVGYADTEIKTYAPALHLDSPANYIVAYNLLRAHARVYRLYDKRYRRAKRFVYIAGSQSSL